MASAAAVPPTRSRLTAAAAAAAAAALHLLHGTSVVQQLRNGRPRTERTPAVAMTTERSRTSATD